MTPSLFIAAPIDVDLWNRAGWSSVAWVHYYEPNIPPCMGLIFANEPAGRAIFTEWRARFGKADRGEYLRIAIIEGRVPGQAPGYWIHIGAEPDAVRRSAGAAGMGDPELLVTNGRILHMNPRPGSPNLVTFKTDLARHGRYALLPVFHRRGRHDPDFSLAIEKKQIHFRQAAQIGPGDIDYPCVVQSRDRSTRTDPFGIN